MDFTDPAKGCRGFAEQRHSASSLRKMARALIVVEGKIQGRHMGNLIKEESPLVWQEPNHDRDVVVRHSSRVMSITRCAGEFVSKQRPQDEPKFHTPTLHLRLEFQTVCLVLSNATSPSSMTNEYRILSRNPQAWSIRHGYDEDRGTQKQCEYYLAIHR